MIAPGEAVRHVPLDLITGAMVPSEAISLQQLGKQGEEGEYANDDSAAIP
jgi:hypothetical protein